MHVRIRRITTILALVLASLGAARAGAADDESYGLLLRSKKTIVPAPVLGQMIHVRVTGIVARATVTQIFTNPTARQVEAAYVFPLPETAAVDALRMVVGDRVIEGEIKTRDEAAETYRRAAREGRKGVLLEQQRPNVFTASVTRIGPGETVEVEIEMQFDVDYDLGTFRLRFPTVVAPRYEAADSPALLQPPTAGSSGAGDELNPTAFRVDVDPGFPTARVESASHAIRVEKGSGHRFSVELADELAPADRDFVLEWTPEPGTGPRVATFVEEEGGERYVLLMVVPPPPEALAALRLPREAIFVIDVSGSMAGTRLQQAREAVLMSLDQLQAGDKLNVIWFASDAGSLYSASRDVDSQTLADGRRFVEGLAADGNTEMAKALKTALADDEPSSPLVRQVIFVTDGQVTNEEQLFHIIQKRLGRSRIFTVGIGGAPNSHFMRRAAALGRGTFTFIADSAEVAENMGALLRKLDSPVVKDVRVLWEDPSVEAWPEPVGDLYLGEPLVVAARVHGDSRVHISGWQREKRLEATLPLETGEAADGIGKLWARRKIDALEADRAAGADPEEVRSQIVDLGLRHHLVTSFTSLVSVDILPTVPVDETPRRHVMPVNPVADVPPGGEIVEEVTVVSESPLVDARQSVTTSCLAGQELEEVPASRDPWAALQAVPGIATDRIHVAGSESALPSTLVGPGSTATENVWTVDGVVVTDAGPTGTSPTFYDFDAFEEVEISTGGSDVTSAHGGVSLNLMTQRGTNEWRAGGRLARTGSRGSAAETAARDRVEAGDERGGSAGGPLVLDRLWAWGTYSRRDAARTALDGEPSSALLEGGAAKLNAQLTASTSLTAGWNLGDALRRGLDAGPERSPEASLDASAHAETASLDATHVVSSSLYFDALAASHEHEEDSSSNGTGAALWAADGVLRGGGRGTAERRKQSQVRVEGSYFFDTGPGDHDLTFGAERRDVTRSEDGAWPGESDVLNVAGENLGVEGTFFRLGIPGRSTSERAVEGSWVQDVWTWRRLVVKAGLRFDRQRGSLAPAGAGIDWATLAPRLSLALALDEDQSTLVRASWARFAQQMTHDLVTRSDPAAAGEALFRFTDANGDGLWQAGEASLLLGAEGLFRPHQNDPGLAPAIDDEIVFGVEHEAVAGFAISLFVTHRRRSDVHETRDLVIDETGALRTARAGDYVLDHDATGELPDSTRYSVPVYSLRPGVVDAGASLLVNGDRELGYDGVTLRFHKRLEYRWAARAHFHYGRQEWRLGPGWALHHDPTNLLGSGDDDGALYVEAPIDVDLGTSPWVGATWSAYLSGLVKLFPDRPWGFSMAGALHLRQGYPLPYYVWDLASADGLPRRVQVTEDVDSFRLDDVVTVDLRLEKEARLFHQLTGTLSLDALNVFDEDAGLRRELDLSGPRGHDLEETVASRAFRLGVLLRWN